MQRKRRAKQFWAQIKRLKILPIALILMAIMELSVLANVGRTPVGGAAYRFVQLDNGQTVEAQAVPGAYRSDQVVSRFASDVVTLGFKWDHTKQDIQIDRYLFPASYHLITWLMPDETRLRWLETYISKYGGGDNATSGSGVNRRSLDYHVVLTQDPIVTQVKDGQWSAKVRGIRFIANRAGNIVGHEKIGFEFMIQAINPKQSTTWQLADSDLEPCMEKFWRDGLAVMDFVDLGAA